MGYSFFGLPSSICRPFASHLFVSPFFFNYDLWSRDEWNWFLSVLGKTETASAISTDQLHLDLQAAAWAVAAP